MKNIVYILSFLLIGMVTAQEKPKEIKEEAEIKVVKTKDSKKNTEKKVKVVTRESENVELDKNDAKKINQNRINATKKVEKMVMIDDDGDDAYDLLSKQTYFVSGDETYKFSPNNQGFDIAFNTDKKEFVKVGKAWTSSNNGTYIIRGKMHNGIGYFTSDGNFVVEHYDKDTNTIVLTSYMRGNPNM